MPRAKAKPKVKAKVKAKTRKGSPGARRTESRAARKRGVGGNVFISYSRSDAAVVEKLAQALEGPAFGHTVWLDRAEIVGGDEWSSEIVRAIEACDAFVLCLSSVSIISDEVQKEVSLAGSRKKTILPVLLEPVRIPRSIEYQLASVHRTDLGGDWDRGLTELGKALAKALRELPKRQFLSARSFVAKEERTVSPAERVLRDAVFEKFSQAMRQDPAAVRFAKQKLFTLNHLNDMRLSVSQLKAALVRTGYFKGAVDDEFTPDVADAVARLQREHNLDDDGIFGRFSYGILSSLLERS